METVRRDTSCGYNITTLESLLGWCLLILPWSRVWQAAPLFFVPSCSCWMIKIHRGQVRDRAQHLSSSVCLPSRDTLPAATLVGQRARQLKPSAKQPLIAVISMEVPGCGCFSCCWCWELKVQPTLPELMPCWRLHREEFTELSLLHLLFSASQPQLSNEQIW